ncbi:Regulator of sigma D [invertebrate metagenome]|uniref:Regulator of sigma D n=1 Tax=invertebrate metagenome TaxID=1711999 RepID=A0A2H9TC13_9ZZZZ
MLEGCRSARARWGGQSEVIDQLLNERQELIVLYCSINGMEPFMEDRRPVSNKLKELCQLMVDYISAGHFEVYEGVLQTLLNTGKQESVRSIYSRIEGNTERCLEFNDHCEQIGNLQQLKDALSQLGETLEERFMLEDQLLESMQTTQKTEL